MVIKFSLLILMIVSNQFLFSQEMCPPSNLLSSSGDRSISLSWRHVNDSSSDDLLFLECFPECEIPSSATITHEVDNGGGGWFRGTDGNFYCWEGPDCDLNPNGVGVAAIAI